MELNAKGRKEVRAKEYTSYMYDVVKKQTLKNKLKAGQWWRTPLTPALGRQRQVDLCEFKDSLVYKS